MSTTATWLRMGCASRVRSSEADADGSDEVVFTVDGTDYEVPDPEVGDRLPGDAVTVVYDPRDPSNSNLEDDSVAWHLHWFFLGVGLFFLAVPAMACRRGGLRSRRTGRPQVGEGASRPTPTGDAAHATGPERPRTTASPAGAAGAVCAGFRR